MDAEASRVGLQRIYSNLGPKTDTYLATDGWSLTGFNSYGSRSSAFPLPFLSHQNRTPTSRKWRAAIQYNGGGANQVNIGIYSDDLGVPGTLLAGPVPVKNLPPFPSCCALAVADFSPLPIAAGILGCSWCPYIGPGK